MLFETSMTAPVFGLRRDMNRLFDDMMSRSMPTSAWMPPVDVRENNNEIVLSLELPGVQPQDVEVTTDNGVLTVRGTKHAQQKEGSEDQYHIVERSYGSFTRSFRLPKGIDEGKITADFENGVLHIRVPKAALPQPKRIQIGQQAAQQGDQQGGQHVSAGQGQSNAQIRQTQQGHTGGSSSGQSSSSGETGARSSATQSPGAEGAAGQVTGGTAQSTRSGRGSSGQGTKA